MKIDAVQDTPDAGFAPYLTYEPFYGLREKPFALSSDPRFLYKSPGHAVAFDRLSAGIRRREGLIVLSGEIGMGKTTLCRAVLSQLDRKTFSTFVPDPFVTREDLLKTLLLGFGVVSVADLNGGRLHGASRQDLSYPLYEFLDSLVPLQAFAVLVIDEAQNLSLGVMEELRILAELERREKLLQVVLVGQPELRDNLRLPQMRQVEQRVTVRCELLPLGVTDVGGYVRHRLSVAAERPGGVYFTGGAIEAVHAASGGTPRVINLVCDRALQIGSQARTRTIDRETILAAVRDLGLSERPAVAVDGAESLPLPFEEDAAADPAPDRAAAATVAPRRGTDAAPRPPMEALESEHAFEADAPAVAADAAAVRDEDALGEFASEPSPVAASAYHRPIRVQQPNSLWSALARAFGLMVAVLGIAFGAGVMDGRAALDRLLPTPVALPTPPDRWQALSAGALAAPDALAAALTDKRAHEADTYTIHIGSLEDRAAAERLIADLSSNGYRARWSEIRTDTDAPVQQVYVDGYGRLEDALTQVARLRGHAGVASPSLTRMPGAALRASVTTKCGTASC